MSVGGLAANPVGNVPERGRQLQTLEMRQSLGASRDLGVLPFGRWAASCVVDVMPKARRAGKDPEQGVAPSDCAVWRSRGRATEGDGSG